MSSPRPPFDVPAGAVAKVSIIDSTLRLSGLKASHLIKPPIEGWEEFPTVPTWSFLVESSTGKKALFDLGVHTDLTKYIPRTQNNIKKNGWTVETKEAVADVIQRHGLDPKEINSIIWSHYHFDHIGDTTTFPSSTELVVGPGFQAAVLPGYPANPDAPVTEEDLSGRAVREISFSGSVAAPQDLGLQFGGFPAHDFFGDGSFYLLDTPGHCVGHMAGLARTSSATGGQRDTFIMMGGDLCHHGAEIRPSPYLALPEAEAEDLVAGRGGVAAWRELNVKRGRRADGPFADPAVNDDEELAHETIRRTMVADADPDVWFVFAHDTALWEGVDLFPEKANGWREKGWKEKTMWAFLTDLLPAVVGKGQ